MTHEQTASEALDGVPAVFRLPASKKSLAQNQFRFVLPDEPDTVYSIPKLRFLRPSLAVKIESMRVNDAVVELLEEFQPGLLDKLDDVDQLEALVLGWAQASGITLGESKPSSDSSENTEGQPNTTSGPTDEV